MSHTKIGKSRSIVVQTDSDGIGNVANVMTPALIAADNSINCIYDKIMRQVQYHWHVWPLKSNNISRWLVPINDLSILLYYRAWLWILHDLVGLTQTVNDVVVVQSTYRTQKSIGGYRIVMKRDQHCLSLVKEYGGLSKRQKLMTCWSFWVILYTIILAVVENSKIKRINSMAHTRLPLLLFSLIWLIAKLFILFE